MIHRGIAVRFLSDADSHFFLRTLQTCRTHSKLWLPTDLPGLMWPGREFDHLTPTPTPICLQNLLKGNICSLQPDKQCALHLILLLQLSLLIHCTYIYIYIYIYIYKYIYIYTGCNRRNGPDFGRVFLMLKYPEKPQNTSVQSWTVWEIMASEVWNFDSCYTLTDCQIRIETGRNMWFL